MSAEVMKPRGKMTESDKAWFWDKLAALDKSTALLGKIALFREWAEQGLIRIQNIWPLGLWSLCSHEVSGCKVFSSDHSFPNFTTKVPLNSKKNYILGRWSKENTKETAKGQVYLEISWISWSSLLFQHHQILRKLSQPKKLAPRKQTWKLWESARLGLKNQLWLFLCDLEWVTSSPCASVYTPGNWRF